MPGKPTHRRTCIIPMAIVRWTGPCSSTPPTPHARAEVRRLSVGKDGTLSVKVKELIVLGILASRGLQYGVEAHIRRAVEYGATKDELFEAGSCWIPGSYARMGVWKAQPVYRALEKQCLQG